MSRVDARGERLIGLQVLRAIAALMVVFHHARLSVPGSEVLTSAGESGVDIFFVISGFVMAYTTGELSASSSIRTRIETAGRFIRNRLLRVVPLYWVAIAWTAHRGFGSRFTASDIAKDMFFIPHVSTEFPRWVYPVLVQGWTLNYEMFFYLLFAISLLSASWSRRILTICIAMLVAAGIWWATRQGVPSIDETQRWTGHGAQQGQSLLFATFYTNNIMLEFCFGVALERFCRTVSFPAWPRWCFALLSCLGFAALASMHLQWPRGLMQGLAATLIVWASIPACAGLKLRLLELLGNASFAIYLFHWASFAILKPVMTVFGSGPQGPSLILLLVFAHLVVATVVGVAIHVTVEKPMTRVLKRYLGGRIANSALAGASP